MYKVELTREENRGHTWYLARAVPTSKDHVFPWCSGHGDTPKEALGKCRAELEALAEGCWDAIEDIEFKRYTDLTEDKIADAKSTT
ncbi:hypothetical protein LCGC14_2773430 [marine sediment metagenome]|uniref:Uncharacterized protein n=1 Tax=marine sediment metagenome TaxID=412755 RepID=A0A0F9B467_9ZZZZ